VPEPALNVPLFKKLFSKAKVPLPPLTVPSLVKFPVEVAIPEPTSKVAGPLFCTFDPKDMKPLEDPMLPVDETAPVTVRVPEVEVTVPPEGTVMVEVAVRLKLTRFKVPEAAMVLILPGVALKFVVVAAGITTSSPVVGM
jgi:hypothetical protein